MKRKWTIHEVLIGASVPTIIYWLLFALVVSFTRKISFGQALIRWYSLLFLAFVFIYGCFQAKKIIVRQKEEEERKKADDSRED